ncbi:RNA polymerase sigma factor [Sutcliffiella halmapala]|uniref:RNA polymerase sigma factor n=1 Tax=Sutcliffiella halmapala TaxID=79882 RepID=UPI001F3B8B16|nr:RNA polymerase sigma factor [Sutcliffiella halmapala]
MKDTDQMEFYIGEWYQQYSNQIFRYILVMVGERQQARDLMQETFINAFKYIKDFRGEASPKTWLYRIARNVTIDYQRKKNPIYYLVDSFSPIKSHQSTPEEFLELGEDIQQLYIALSKLKKDYREVIILRKIKEFSIKETSIILDWKESRVKTMLHRGLLELREQMVKEGYTSETIS